MAIVINYSYEDMLNIAAIAEVTGSVKDTWMSSYSCCNAFISPCKGQFFFCFCNY